MFLSLIRLNKILPFRNSHQFVILNRGRDFRYIHIWAVGKYKYTQTAGPMEQDSEVNVKCVWAFIMGCHYMTGKVMNGAHSSHNINLIPALQYHHQQPGLLSIKTMKILFCVINGKELRDVTPKNRKKRSYEHRSDNASVKVTYDEMSICISETT